MECKSTVQSISYLILHWILKKRMHQDRWSEVWGYCYVVLSDIRSLRTRKKCPVFWATTPHSPQTIFWLKAWSDSYEFQLWPLRSTSGSVFDTINLTQSTLFWSVVIMVLRKTHKVRSNLKANLEACTDVWRSNQVLRVLIQECHL